MKLSERKRCARRANSLQLPLYKRGRADGIGELEMQVFNSKHTREKRVALRKAQTIAEQVLWARLRAGRFNKLKFFRQYGIGGYIADFYCPSEKLVV